MKTLTNFFGNGLMGVVVILLTGVPLLIAYFLGLIPNIALDYAYRILILGCFGFVVWLYAVMNGA